MRIVFFGTPDFAVPSLNTLLESDNDVVAVITQPDRIKGRHRTLSPPPVKKFALRENLKVYQPANIKDAIFLDELSHMRPEIIVVVAYGKIFPSQILYLPLHRCINVHASLLPKYRGAAPIQWAIIKGEYKTGVTTIFMDEGLDTGDILLQEQTTISDDDTAETLNTRLAQLGASLLIGTITKIKDSSIKPTPQKGTPSYAPPLKKEDGKINWELTAREIFNFVRGMYPWPGAYCYLNNERIKIINVKALEGTGIAGWIEKVDREFIIGTGNGLVSVLELQPEGKKSMTSKAFLQGRYLQKGIFLHDS